MFKATVCKTNTALNVKLEKIKKTMQTVNLTYETYLKANQINTFYIIGRSYMKHIKDKIKYISNL